MLTIRQFSKLLAFVLWTVIESPSSLALARMLPREATYYFTTRDDHDDDDDDHDDGRDSDDDSDNDSDSGDEHKDDFDQDEVGSAGGSGLGTGATIAIVVVIVVVVLLIITYLWWRYRRIRRARDRKKNAQAELPIQDYTQKYRSLPQTQTSETPTSYPIRAFPVVTPFVAVDVDQKQPVESHKTGIAEEPRYDGQASSSRFIEYPDHNSRQEPPPTYTA